MPTFNAKYAIHHEPELDTDNKKQPSVDRECSCHNVITASAIIVVLRLKELRRDESTTSTPVSTNGLDWKDQEADLPQVGRQFYALTATCVTSVSLFINLRHPRDFTSHTFRRRTLYI